MKSKECMMDFEQSSVRMVIRLILNLYGGTGIMFAFVLLYFKKAEDQIAIFS